MKSSTLWPDPHDLPPRVAEFRKKYRREVIGRFYNGKAHLGFVIVGCFAVIALAVSRIVPPVTVWEWLTIPIVFFLSNIVEFYGHRGPMHQRFKRLVLVYRRHVLEHHQFFTDRYMTCRSFKDFKIVLFPPLHLFLYLGVVASPIGVLLFLFVSQNVAWLYVATVTFYFMQYEALHFLYHLDEGHRAATLPVIRTLRRHHQIHHNQELMNKVNFNITWPIADALFGTLYPGHAQGVPSEKGKFAA